MQDEQIRFQTPTRESQDPDAAKGNPSFTLCCASCGNELSWPPQALEMETEEQEELEIEFEMDDDLYDDIEFRRE